MKAPRTLNRKIALACRILYNEGIFDAHGHLSARIPGSESFLITPRESPAFVHPRGLIRLDRDGRVLEGSNPPSEASMHATIYRMRQDVTSVSHFHSPMAIALGVMGKPIQPLHGEGRLFFAGVPIIDRSLRIRSRQAADAVAARLGNARAILLRGHGAVVVGETVEMATIGSIYLENAARMQCLCTLLGTAKPLSREESVESPNPSRIWEYYVKRLAAPKPLSTNYLF